MKTKKYISFLLAWFLFFSLLNWVFATSAPDPSAWPPSAPPGWGSSAPTSGWTSWGSSAPTSGWSGNPTPDSTTTSTPVTTGTSGESTTPTNSTSSNSTSSSPSSGWSVVDYSGSAWSTSSNSNPCTPLKVGSTYINPSTGKAVNENCIEITPVDTVTTSTTTTSTSKTTTTTTNSGNTNTWFQDLNTNTWTTKTTQTAQTNNTAKQTTQQVTGWDIDSKPAGTVSKNDLNPVSVNWETSSTATISKGGELDQKEILKDTQLKEAVIKWFFSINDQKISVDPNIDSMTSIIDKINASKSLISAKYNANLDRVEISSKDINSIIQLWSWQDSSNFLWVLNLIPKENVFSEKFEDVKKDNWSFKYISPLFAMDIVRWKTDIYFWAQDNITRLESLKIILEATKTSIKRDKEHNISDVSSTSWGYKYVWSAIENNILWEIVKFNPNVAITRWEMLEWIMKAKKITIDKTIKTAFKDVTTSSRYYYYISNAEKLWIINGYDDGTFKPESYITRQEFSKIIFNILSTRN